MPTLHRMSVVGGLLVATLLATARPGDAQVDVLTYRYDNARSGTNLHETVLKKSNVKKNTFGKLAFRIVDGNVYAQPLIVSQAKVANRPTPVDLVIVATEHNSVYAFDANDTVPEPGGQESQKALWHTGPDGAQGLGAHIEANDLYGRINAAFCTDLTTEIGITSTPAIKLTRDTAPKEGVIFVVAKSLNGTQVQQKLFALSLADGTPLTSGGLVIAGSVNGPNGPIAFDPLLHLNRPALLLDHDILYIAFGGHCDVGDYRGWVFAYDVSTPGAPHLVDVLTTTVARRGGGNAALDGRGGIWMSGHGLATADDGVFFATGDGSYNVAQASSLELSNSVVKVKVDNGKLQVQDWFSPQNRDELKAFDVDLGSGGAVPMPNSHLIVAGGKEGRIYLIDRANMGRGATMSLQSVQVTNSPLKRVDNPQNAGDILYWNIHGAPVIWTKQATQMFLYVIGEEDHLKQYKLVPDAGPGGWKFDNVKPFKISKESVALPNPPNGLPFDKTRNMTWMPGGFITVSSNGTDTGTAIVWATMPYDANANHEVVRGVLRAFDANDVSKGQLWSSEDNNIPNDSLGTFAKFNPPVVANGKVFVATFQQERIDNGVHHKANGGNQPALVIYGLK